MEVPTLVYASLILLAAWLFTKWYSDPLRRIPTVGGPSFPLLSYLGAVKFARRPNDVLQEGYAKYHGKAFKVALPDRWVVVVSGLDGVEDLRRRPENELALSAASNQLLQRNRILGDKVLETRWHSEVLRTTFTQDLPFILPELIDELPVAVQDNLPCTDGWTAVDVRPAVLNVMAQMSNRAFVGLPLCRCKEYLQLAIDFTVQTMVDANAMKLTPRVFRPIVARYLTKTRSALVAGKAYIEPIIRTRRAEMERFGDDWSDKPHDLLQYFIDYASERKTSDDMVAQRLFQTNFAAIHTSSLSMTNVLLNLASSPECITPLRAEVEELIASYGWTKDAIDRMWSVDSFVRESQRLHTLSPVVLNRVAMRDLTLVDGTFVPQGTYVAAAVAPAHRDSDHYPRADTFDAFRFSRMREEKGGSATQAFTHTSGKWLAFGHGKHACPGRFFASDALKALLAHIVLNFDIKADVLDSMRSGPTSAGGKGMIMVRKRASGSL